MSDPRIVVVGAGAAGIAAGIELARTRTPFRILEARRRLGGRAHTVEVEGLPLDLGCGWLHRAERNVWRDAFEAAGLEIDHSSPPWGGPAVAANFPLAEQHAFHQAFAALETRLDAAAERCEDSAGSDQLEPGGRWNALLDAFSAAYNGAAFDRISVKDYARFDEGETNRRVASGYGAAIARFGRDLPTTFGAAVVRIDHAGPRVRVETADGEAMEAEAVIVTLPTSLLAREAVRFHPPLPGKAELAAGLPLGCAGKVFLHVDGDARDLPAEGLLYGSTTTRRTATYHLRPFGRPFVESYFGGATADELEGAGAAAAADFAVGQMADALGSAWRARLRPLATTDWSLDPFSRGAYSHALPGHADDRVALAEPVDGRLFFAGEACSRDAFSSAHGAAETGTLAARAAVAALRL